MNDFQTQIYKTIDILTEQKLKALGFDMSKRGKVISVNSTVAIVLIDGEEYTCKLRRGINVAPNDIVYIKFPQNNESDKYIEAILGINKVTETIEITAEEILAKLKTVDGVGSGLDADMLDGKHASEFALVGDLGDIDISGETIVQNINSTNSKIDDKNLSENVNDAIVNKHNHTNKSVIDGITQNKVNDWDTIVDKANKSEVPTKLSELDKDINFDERYYTEGETDNLLTGKVDNNRVLTNVPLNAKFTDTLYVHPDTHPSSMITGLPTSLPASGGNADTVGGFTLGMNIPSGSKLTDTIYTHPTTAGNKHIPTGGVVGQILKNTTSGTTTWQDEYTYTHPSTHNIGEVDGLQGTLDGKVDDNQVLTNVPSGAKFTDTITTINGKTGVIAKADIVALGIPTSDTNTTYTAGLGLILTGTIFTPDFGIGAGKVVQGNDSRLSDARIPLAHNHTKANITDFAHTHLIGDLPAYPTLVSLGASPINHDHNTLYNTKAEVTALLEGKVSNNRVLTDVPLGAKFTDTIFIHPATHPTSMITGLANVASSGNYNDLVNKPAIPTDTNQLAKTDVYTKTEVNNLMSGAGQGDMMKNIYDTNNNGKVDVAEVAESVEWTNVNGKKIFPASVTSESSLTIPHGVAPTTLVNGDMWSTTSALFFRLNGTTRTMAHTASWSTVSQAEAEAGIATSQRFWTAQRVRQAIESTPTYIVSNTQPTNNNLLWINTSL